MSKYLNLSAPFICLIFFLAPFIIFSQSIDTNAVSNDSLKVSGIYENGFNIRNIKENYFEIDTLLSGFQKKENFYHANSFYASLGKTGLAERNMIFQSDYCSDQISSHKYFSHYFYNNTNTKYYSTLSPFSNVFYMMGPKKEQLFDFLITRNFGKLLNASVDYYILYSPGIYQLQKSNDNYVSVTSNFHSENKKYFALVDYFYNRMKMDENGGILHDAYLTENRGRNRASDSVKLYDAQNRVKESGIYLRQYYFPGYSQNKKDTIKGNEKYYAFGRFSYSLLFKNIKEVYFDGNPSSGFYQNIYFPDSSATHDSLQVNFIENYFGWSNIKYNNIDSLEQHIIFSIGVKHQKQHIYSIDTVTDFHTFIPEAECTISFDPLVIDARGFYISSGYNKNDYSIKARADYLISGEKTIKKFISLGLSSISQTPCWFDQNYSSNHFQWNYDFVKINTKNLYLRYSGNDLSSEISFFNIGNAVYYDNYARPKQLIGNSQLFRFRVKKLFKWKKWNFDNEIIYQKISGNDVIRMPEIISNHSLYFSKDFFKKALSAQFGAEVTFFSSYYPLAYMPATRQFYLQNEYKSSAYPYIDVFVNLKIKRVRIFLKLDHANSGIMGYNYFMVPHYPMTDRCLKFGLSWTFYN